MGALTSSQRETGSLVIAPGWGVVPAARLFAAAALLLLVVTKGPIPAVAARTGIEPVLLWFVLGSLGVFLPLVVTAYVLLRMEGVSRARLLERLRFRRLTGDDWWWTLGGMVAIALLSGVSLACLRMFSDAVRLHPSFMTMEPLAPGRYWVLTVWLPFWVLNILSEEILWRGVLLPRQEAALGRAAWLVNGAGWLAFHVAFGPVILLTLWPITFILPYVVQRTRNSSTGVLIHAGLNGPGFLAVAFGLV